MSRFSPTDDNEQEADLRIDARRTTQHQPARRRSTYVKRSRPTGFNGIHRRRNKRWTW